MSSAVSEDPLSCVKRAALALSVQVESEECFLQSTLHFLPAHQAHHSQEPNEHESAQYETLSTR